jgi:DNA-binding NtrC family response regulator
MVGQSIAMRRVFGLIERVRESSVSVVIEGESGTGKELVARAIHAGSNRRNGPFIAVNCGALPEHLIESELFGHVRGAFTGADRDKKGLLLQAHDGTLFLDEFADIPARMQLDLLRVLQEGKVRPVGAETDLPVDVRVITASNRALKELVAERKLREDLYYRLSIVEMRLPALRERTDDIPLLCEHFLSRVATKHGTGAKRLSRAALQCIMTSNLPGNVRQLEHLLISAAMMADGTVIEPQDLPLADVNERPAIEDLQGADGSDVSLASSLPPMPADLTSHKQREKQRIIEALERNAWNRAKTATALGIPRRTFYRRLAEFGILD